MAKGHAMRPIFLLLLVLIGGVATTEAGWAGDARQPSAGGPAHTRTGKERLGDKGSDEQRMDDCKVPVGRRTKVRPATCPWDVEAGHHRPSA